jgi:hypothetical protein
MIRVARLERERHTEALPLAERERHTDALSLADQDTMPLPTGAVSSAAAFRAVLARYHLVPLHLARLSAVPYITIWSIYHGLPVSAAHAALVRQGLLWSTGRAYDEPIAVISEAFDRTRPLV